MSDFIVDASVVAKWFLDEILAEHAERVLTAGNHLAAPSYLLLEMDSVFSKRVRLSQWTLTFASLNRQLLRRLPIELYPDDYVSLLGFNISGRTRQSLYDCLYLALAMRLGWPMVTADRRFFENISAGPLRTHIRWVEDVPGGS